MATERDIERYERLAAQVKFPESWIPEPGDTLIGEVVRWDTGTTRSGEAREILVVRTQEGVERSFWMYHAKAIYDLIASKVDLEAQPPGEGYPDERKAMPGDFVAIHYKGLFPMAETGNDAHSYRIAVDKAASSASGLTDDEEAARAAYEAAQRAEESDEPNGSFGQTDRVPY